MMQFELELFCDFCRGAGSPYQRGFNLGLIIDECGVESESARLLGVLGSVGALKIVTVPETLPTSQIPELLLSIAAHEGIVVLRFDSAVPANLYPHLARAARQHHIDLANTCGTERVVLPLPETTRIVAMGPRTAIEATAARHPDFWIHVGHIYLIEAKESL